MDLSGFEIFDSRIFWGRIGKYFFGWIDFTKDFFRDSNNLSICSSASVSRKLRLRNLA